MDTALDLLRRGIFPDHSEHKLVARGIYNDIPPDYQDRNARNPTLLVSWWCTIFALTTILIRIMGRWVRTEKLFVEDKIMCWAIIPLMIRMGFVHVVLIWGTNNTTTDGLSHIEILHKEMGSKLVLPARIIFAAFIWMTKLSILEFLKRTTTATWSRTYDLILRFVYGFLLLTFIAIIIGTLTECRPFPHYWQVVPDPGPQCREGLVQLITMGVCDIVTDVVLIAFPIPVVLRSSMPLRKKLSMIVLFCLSVVLICITAYRIPTTIERRADQPYRSLLASLEILAAAGVSNAVIIGSFIRDKGVKKIKFRAASVGDASLNGSNTLQRIATTRSAAVTMKHWGSDEDLVRDLGVALPPTLRFGSAVQARAASAAPRYEPSEDQPSHSRKCSQFEPNWSFQNRGPSRSRSRNDGRRSSVNSTSTTSTDIKLRDLQASLDEPVSPGVDMDTEPLSKQMSFFDVGGLVDTPKTELRHPLNRRPPTAHSASSPSPSPSQRGRAGSKAFLTDIGGLLGRHKEEEDEDHPRSLPASRSLTPSKLMERRRVSRSPNPVRRLVEAERERERERESSASGVGRSRAVKAKDSGQALGPHELSFGDVGGLLGR